MTKTYGHFDDSLREYVITDPLTPAPWINYLTNRRLTAFISQNAGGMLWYLEPQARRISRYHYMALPADRPGFYVYVKDRETGAVWNPHVAPSCTGLDRYECRHSPGVTRFFSEKAGIHTAIDYAIPPEDDVMLWNVVVKNATDRLRRIEIVSYIEFGLLETANETWWCYDKNQASFEYDRPLEAIRYDYHGFAAAHTPRMLFGSTADVSGFDCSRDAFVGRGRGLDRPEALFTPRGLTGSELPCGGHGCGSLAVNATMEPGEQKSFAYVFAIGESWEEAGGLMGKYRAPAAAEAGIRAAGAFWSEPLARFQVKTGDAPVDRFVNTWNPWNCLITSMGRTVSTDHTMYSGLRFRDTIQDAMGITGIDPAFAEYQVRRVLATQASDGAGCYRFDPYGTVAPEAQPDRSDNSAWPVDTILSLMAETGDAGILDAAIPYRDGGQGTVYDHLLCGLRYIYNRRGVHGLPMMFDADWNDDLILFGDRRAESVMLGMQLVHACRRLGTLAVRRGLSADAEWCRSVADELTAILNSTLVWDGAWYRRLLLTNGTVVGSATCAEGKIFLEPQVWAVISGVGAEGGRGATAMQSVAERLETPHGLCLLSPPYTGIPTPADTLQGSAAGTNENGGIFCHANVWAIIAEAMLGHPDRAFRYYRRLIPEVASANVGPDIYGREPYASVSTILAPASGHFGQGGISWMSGTAAWMYTAATQYLLGIKPEPEGLRIRPCLPSDWRDVRVTRRFRGKTYEIAIRRAGGEGPAFQITVNGKPLTGDLIRVN